MPTIPVAPPKSWVDDKPEWMTPGMDIRVSTKDGEYGRAAGYFFDWETCLLNGEEGECWTPPPSPTKYETFHQGALVDADGDTHIVGVIGGGGDHAPPHWGVEQAAAYYADVDKQMLVGKLYEDEVGGYFLGVAVPEMSEMGIAKVNRSASSGDWRWRVNMRTPDGGTATGYDGLGPWIVTRPGLPLDRRGFAKVASVASASEHPTMIRTVTGHQVRRLAKTAAHLGVELDPATGSFVPSGGEHGAEGEGGGGASPEIASAVETLQLRLESQSIRIERLEALVAHERLHSLDSDDIEFVS